MDAVLETAALPLSYTHLGFLARGHQQRLDWELVRVTGFEPASRASEARGLPCFPTPWKDVGRGRTAMSPASRMVVSKTLALFIRSSDERQQEKGRRRESNPHLSIASRCQESGRSRRERGSGYSIHRPIRVGSVHTAVYQFRHAVPSRPRATGGSRRSWNTLSLDDCQYRARTLEDSPGLLYGRPHVVDEPLLDLPARVVPVSGKSIPGVDHFSKSSLVVRHVVLAETGASIRTRT